jgi:hypothetical protein
MQDQKSPHAGAPFPQRVTSATVAYPETPVQSEGDVALKARSPSPAQPHVKPLTIALGQPVGLLTKPTRQHAMIWPGRELIRDGMKQWDRWRASRKTQAWQGVVTGAVMIVVGVVLIAKHVSVFGGSALPIVGAETAPLLLGLYQLFTAREDHRRK